MPNFPRNSMFTRNESDSSAIALWQKITIIILCVLIFFIGGWFYVIKPPNNAPDEYTIIIDEGSGVKTIAQKMADKNLIRSPGVFTLVITILNKQVVAGDYKFSDASTLPKIVARVTQGRYGDVEIKTTLSEGITRRQMGEIVGTKLPNVTQEEFVQKTEGREGRLYPDTYFFFPSTTTKEVVRRLLERFREQIDSLTDQISKSKYTLEEILIMSSIVEREANDDREEEKKIASILRKRLESGMPLQVDAPFVYTIGKGSSELTQSDLASDSAYNTYENKGLPPTPISNPDIKTIRATLNPVETPYLFYLHGKDGRVHYARTFEEHLINKRNYLE